MARKSDFEALLETAFNYPIFGIIASSIIGIFGLYLSNKGAQPVPKGIGIAFLPMYQMFGKVCYWAAGIIVIVSIVGYIWSYVKRKRQTTFFSSKKSLDSLKNMTWKEFEGFVGDLFSKLGYAVEVTGGLKDGGVDIRARKDGKMYLIQCKKYRISKVTLSMVRDFYGAVHANLNMDVGYFITTGIFTLEALKFAEDKPIELIDGARLMEYVAMANTARSEPTPLITKPGSAQAIKHFCPKCGASMVLRTAKRGSKVGSQFLGCSTYPKCNGIQNND